MTKLAVEKLVADSWSNAAKVCFHIFMIILESYLYLFTMWINEEVKMIVKENM